MQQDIAVRLIQKTCDCVASKTLKSTGNDTSKLCIGSRSKKEERKTLVNDYHSFIPVVIVNYHV